MANSNLTILLGILFFVSANFFSYRFFHETSFKDGTLFASLIFATVFLFNKNWSRKIIDIEFLYIYLAVVIAILLHFALASLISPDVDKQRFLLSLLLFAFILLVRVLVLSYLSNISKNTLHTIITLTYRILLFDGIVGAIFIHFLHNKETVLFSEPSHFAIVFIPISLYVSLTTKKKNPILFCLIFSFVLQNLTLLIGTLFIASFVFRKRIFHFILLIIPTLLILTFSPLSEYYLTRILYNAETSNLSSLVFLSGYERSWLALKDTFGVGYGFQQMGVVGDTGFYFEIIKAIQGQNSTLNLYDGGTLASKIIYEFGAFGVILIALFLFFLIKFFIDKKNNYSDPLYVLSTSVYIGFFVELFVRGIGYFSSSFLLFLMGLFFFQKRSSGGTSRIELIPPVSANHLDTLNPK